MISGLQRTFGDVHVLQSCASYRHHADHKLAVAIPHCLSPAWRVRGT